MTSPPILLLLLLAVAFASAAATALDVDAAAAAADSYAALFDSWCARHNRTYPSDEARRERLRVFADNAAFVAAHNAGPRRAHYTLDLNAFADLTHSEFLQARIRGLAVAAVPGDHPAARQEENGPRFRGAAVPASLDWRDKGAVTGVKDQGSCGACWSFSATGAIEGINKIVSGSLVSLSEQELIDCDRSYNAGCNGGLMDYAYKWVVKNHGIDSEDDYPFAQRDGKCNNNKVNRRVVTIDGYKDVPSRSEDALLQAVATQPVSVGICGSERSFQLYSKGIYSGPCSVNLDHAVLIVGYGSEDGKDYWIVKNSWGTQWGMDGYIHMQRNTGNKDGVCGINKMASYPTKTSPNPPPSPGPGPTKCGVLTSCPAGSTCCCKWSVIGICLSWSCCDLDNAVCCSDHRSCCPHDYPVCDTSRGLCLKGNGNYSSIRGAERKPALSNIISWDNVANMLAA